MCNILYILSLSETDVKKMNVDWPDPMDCLTPISGGRMTIWSREETDLLLNIPALAECISHQFCFFVFFSKQYFGMTHSISATR